MNIVDQSCVNGQECKNGGKCNSGHCICDPAYEGTNCENKKNPCDSIPCKNGAQCNPNGLDYTCDCSGTGYQGTYCGPLA
ncbi:unnamed protein product [Adineta steineri]|uniref:EGF-like domain-containing protein n=1 Tax=Adineta steineri TaxID=433720 RepID=A0A814HKD1_9BILA|nr:unnamed protein product [Adineta steineri]